MGENIGFLGEGDVWIRREKADGTWSGWVNSGGADKFEVKAESEIKSQVSKGRGTYGQVIDSVTLPKEPTINVTFIRPNRKVLAAALLGDDAAVDVTGASVTGEEHTAPAIGESMRMAYRGISAVMVDTYTADEDYTVDARNGIITNLAIPAGTELTIDYTYASESGFRISGVTSPKVTLGLYFDGKNSVDGSDCFVEVYEAQVAPSGGWDMLSSDHSPVELEGPCMTPSGGTTPFEIVVKDLT